MGAGLTNLSAQEQIARIRLIRSENVGPVSFRQLLARYGSAVAALDALPDLARRGGKRTIVVAPRQVAEQEITAIEALGGHLLFCGTAPYPRLLAITEEAPPVLATLGHLTLLDRPTVAIVGARNASLVGQNLALRFARDLSAAGVVVVSGLARGIDTAAHRGSLQGGTVAVVAGGLNVFYPPENEALQVAIGRQGLVVSEQPCGMVPQARHFPRRNRIISGLSLGVVVVEAAAKSGSLITANIASDQGRVVLAVPGSPADPRAQGPNGLIREGATLVQSADDILEAIEPMVRRGAAEPDIIYEPEAGGADPDDWARDRVWNLLSLTPANIDELIRAADLPPAVVATVLLELELAGRVNRLPGHRVAVAAHDID